MLMNIKKERLLLIIAGGICTVGCLVISLINVCEGALVKADVIPPSEYTVSLISCTQEANAEGQADEPPASHQGTININAATADEISDFLPGIGEVKAKRIVAYRESAGGFDSVDELCNVKGIGQKTLEKIRPYCRTSD